MFRGIFKNNTFQNVLSIFSSRILNSILYFSITLIMMEFLTVEGYGKYSFYFSLMSFTTFFLSMGINTTYVSLVIHEESEKKQIEYYNSFVTFKLIVFLILAISFFIYYFFSRNLITSVVLFSGLFFGLFESIKPPLQAKKLFKKIALVLPLRNILLIIGVLIIMIFGLISLDLIVWLFFITNFLAFLVFLFISKLRFYELDVYGAFNIMVESKWLFMKDFSDAIMMQSQIFILKYYVDKGLVVTTELGFFSGAFTICMILPIISSSIVNVYLPEMSNYKKNDDVVTYLNNLRKTFPLVLFLGLFFLVGCEYFLNIFFDTKYSGSLPLLKFIIAAIICSFYTKLIGLLFYNKKGFSVILKLSIVHLLIDIPLGLVLSAKMGAVGAAITILSVRFVGFLYIILKLKKLKLEGIQKRLLANRLKEL